MVRQKLCVIALLTGFFRKIPDICPGWHMNKTIG